MSGEASFVLGIGASLNQWHWEDVGIQEEGKTTWGLALSKVVWHGCTSCFFCVPFK